jgi:hypothetical protein
MNSIKSFFQQQHNLRRHPFATTETTAANKTTWKTRGARSYKSFKDFFAKQHRFGRSPFAEMPTSWM